MPSIPVQFTHIPKTAGTAIRKQLLYSNIPSEERGTCHGIRELLLRNWSGCRWLEGHFPYGIHHYMRGIKQTPVYFTMLRNPVEHALSYYSFIKSSSESGGSFIHPHYKDVCRHTLVDFYSLPRHRNMQTRFIAGVLYHRVSKLSAPPLLENLMLSTAKKHLLEKYACYGLVFQFEKSLSMFADLLGWTVDLPDERIKSNPDRPVTEDLSSDMLDALREKLHLDIELYSFALEHFSQQEIAESAI